jgi:calcium-dependent protein kinase
MFDKDNSGFITIEEISSVLGGEDGMIGEAKIWRRIMSEVDKDKDGRIDFEEFKITMSQGA